MKQGLSLEVRLLLGALLSVGAVGGGYSLYQQGHKAGVAQEQAQGKLQSVVSITAPTVTPAAQANAAQATKQAAVDAAKKANPKVAAAASTTAATEAALNNTGPNGEVLPPDAATAQTPVAPTVPVATTTPQGINPAAPLAPVPARNPFLPYSMASTSTTTTTDGGGAITLPPPTPAVPTPTTPPRTTGVTPPPGVTITPAIRPPTTRGEGVLPPVSIPTGQNTRERLKAAEQAREAAAKAAAQQAAVKRAEAKAAAAKAAEIAAQKRAAEQVAAKAAAAAAQLRAAQAAAKQQAKPAEPSLSSALGGGVNAGTGAQGVAGRSVPVGAVTMPDASGTDTQLAQPGVITQVQTPGVGAGTPVDNYIEQHNLDFTAVVLGPINTAVFKIDGGFVVVSEGQKIPDTGIVVSDISTTKATLTLKNDTKTLVLANR